MESPVLLRDFFYTFDFCNILQIQWQIKHFQKTKIH
jgi:hypothetical protein